MSHGVFNFNYLALLLSEILGGPKFTLGGPTPPVRPKRRNLCTQSEYFTISNCVFNCNILVLVVFEILRGPKFTLGGPVPPCTPHSGIFFVSEASTLLWLMAFFNFNFLVLILSDILGWSQIYSRGPYAVWTPRSGEIFHTKQVLHNI